MDTVSKETRSRIMSRIHGKWTLIERRAHMMLVRAGVRHDCHPDAPERPDFQLTATGTMLFIDGCFWHGCPRHYREPKTNKRFWRDKICRNRRRDRQTRRSLRRRGHRVVRVWECRMDELIQTISRRT